jgi:hypothetical protein
MADESQLESDLINYLIHELVFTKGEQQEILWVVESL